LQQENWITRTIDKIVEDRRSWYWDACVALHINGITGDYVEFGSWGGNTMRCAYQGMVDSGRVRPMWAFDSFQGLPPATDERDQHPGWQPGSEHGQGGVEAFHADCDRHGIPREAYTAVEGYYDATLPAIGDGAPWDIAAAYIDCNMYSSAVTVLEFLRPRLKHGMILAFDDYYCWSSTQSSGERRAVAEFFRDNKDWSLVPFFRLRWLGMAFMVESKSLDSCAGISF
jgi:O-methyltransferase